MPDIFTIMKEFSLRALFPHSSLFFTLRIIYTRFTRLEKTTYRNTMLLLDNMGGIYYLSEIYCGFIRRSIYITKPGNGKLRPL